ncbi:MAG: glutamate synthase-related protein, partial [Rectinema sp.]|nr:glutamate synthase-related protein [Rectinema sp.]
MFLKQELDSTTTEESVEEGLDQAAAYFLFDAERISILKSMMLQGQEPVAAFTTKKPPAALMSIPRPLSAYFRQRFAQVTNPPIDAYRESIVMSLENYIGTQHNLLDETPQHCAQLKLERPILSNADISRMKRASSDAFRVETLSLCLPLPSSGLDLAKALEELRERARHVIDSGAQCIILSDRGVDRGHLAIPALLALSALHSALVDARKRHLAGLIVETGEACDVHDIAVLLAFGASGVNPWMVFNLIPKLAKLWETEVSIEELADRYLAAASKGILKIMSKLGISTISSYRGSRLFEIVGLDDALVSQYFRGTESVCGGIGIGDLAEQLLVRHHDAYIQAQSQPCYQRTVPKSHAEGPWPSRLAVLLTEAVRTSDRGAWRKYVEGMESAERPPFAFRDLWHFKLRQPIPIDAVQPLEEIIGRFSVAAMSLGAISPEAHEALAAGANAIGSWSNSGEGGEDAERCGYKERGLDSSNPSKQVASGRFGVTARYLARGLELQIKIAQGAKPVSYTH